MHIVYKINMNTLDISLDSEYENITVASKYCFEMNLQNHHISRVARFQSLYAEKTLYIAMNKFNVDSVIELSEDLDMNDIVSRDVTYDFNDLYNIVNNNYPLIKKYRDMGFHQNGHTYHYYIETLIG